MSAQDPRWANPTTAAAYFELRTLAPRLSGLLYSPTVPDTTLRSILDWSEAVTDPDMASPFSLDSLQVILPALAVAFVAEHAYSLGDPGEGGGGCVDLYDQGYGNLVASVISLAAAIAVALHGDEGMRLVADARADLAGHLNRIAEMISHR